MKADRVLNNFYNTYIMFALSSHIKPNHAIQPTIIMHEEVERLNVWVVEDNETYRESIEQVISATKDLKLAASFENCETLLKKLKRISISDYPHVLLLDIMFVSNTKKAKMSGIEAIQKIKAVMPDTPIVMLTDYDATDYIFNALQRGASGYLHKTSRSKDIQDAIRMASRGGMVVPPAVASRLLGVFQNADVKSEKALSKRELEIIELMAAGKSRKLIAEALFISPNTVDSHLNKIYQKLHVTTGTEAIAKIYGARTPLQPE